MRMYPNRFTDPDKPTVVKKTRAELVHIGAPINGFAEIAKTAETNPLSASILVNMYPEDDRLVTRAGFTKVATMPGGQAVEHLIPYYGSPERLLAATNGTFCDAETGSVLKSGFASNDWSWTAFSDLGDVERVVLCNGNDGVWAWDGLNTADGAPITITKIAKATTPATDAVITVASTDINKFHNYDAVIITGADAGHAIANGPQRIYNVNTLPNTFVLEGVDSSGWGTDQTTGTMTVVVQGSWTTEAIKPPAGNTWLSVNDLAIVIAHQNRLFFADEQNLAVYYLPIQQRYGTLAVLPMNAIFKKGGYILAMNTWTIGGGLNMYDQLCVFTSNGELAIYAGVDPANDFTLVGVYRFSPPLSKWCTTNYGGELYALTATGLTAMSAVLKSGREGVEAADKTVISMFRRNAIAYRANPGWELFLNPNSGRMFCNIPKGGSVYTQMIRGMARAVWSEFHDVPARCWSWIEPYVYHADDLGNVYQMHPTIQSDNGLAIKIDVQTAWNQFKTPAIKHFKMILPYIVTDGAPQPAIDVLVDYDTGDPKNVPDITDAAGTGAAWNVTAWNSEFWVQGTTNWTNWTGVGSIGRVGAVRMKARIFDCTFQITGWDLLYDRGSVFG